MNTQPSQRFRLAWLLLLVGSALCPPLMAQDGEEDASGLGVAIPAGPNDAFEGEGGAINVELAPADADANADARLDPINNDLANSGLIPKAAFEIFPAAVQGEIRDLVSQLLPLLEVGQEKELATFFESQGNRIATMFDQLGLEPNADTLLAVSTSTIKFPNEFEDYAAYLDSLELEPFERDYMLRSHEIAKHYEDSISAALGNRAMVQTTLEDYQSQLETLNERYAEQFREQSIESIERAGADGRRPDIDR
ncbi:MAG: hypothetical protein ACI957_004058 [Verrucomicrobiales bacterium]|jgi:hypothetical protein